MLLPPFCTLKFLSIYIDSCGKVLVVAATSLWGELLFEDIPLFAKLHDRVLAMLSKDWPLLGSGI